jgi:hypothetical protein
MDTIDNIIADRELTAAAKQKRIDRYLRDRGEDGIRIAVETVVDARSEASAAYAAVFLAKLPGREHEKNRAMRGLFARNPRWIAAIAPLVEFADDRTLERLVEQVVGNHRTPGAHAVAYRLAEHFPEHMRAHLDQLAPYGLSELLLPGAPDPWVRALLAQYRRTANGRAAIGLARIGTESARQAVATLEREAPSSRKQFFAALLAGMPPPPRAAAAEADPGRVYRLLDSWRRRTEEASGPKPEGD